MEKPYNSLNFQHGILKGSWKEKFLISPERKNKARFGRVFFLSTSHTHTSCSVHLVRSTPVLEVFRKTISDYDSGVFILVMQCFWVVYREISQEWLDKIKSRVGYSRYTTRKHYITILSHANLTHHDSVNELLNHYNVESHSLITDTNDIQRIKFLKEIVFLPLPLLFGSFLLAFNTSLCLENSRLSMSEYLLFCWVKNTKARQWSRLIFFTVCFSYFHNEMRKVAV